MSKPEYYIRKINRMSDVLKKIREQKEEKKLKINNIWLELEEINCNIY